VIPFAEAVAGIEREITVPRRDPCEECDGSGAAAGHQAAGVRRPAAARAR
jgi:DnaJ-class molecular chaperone